MLAGIAASFALGIALSESGAATLLAGWIGTVAGADPFWSLVVLYVATVVLTELITNNAAGVLMFPIAMAVAQNAGANYLPYVIAIMVGASCGFITPIGYQTNLMVYGPGGYRFSDYVRFGTPLSILVGIGDGADRAARMAILRRRCEHVRPGPGECGRGEGRIAGGDQGGRSLCQRDRAARPGRLQGGAVLIPVILSGGSGTRLWPLSRELYPKQLLPLVGERTMLQETVARTAGLPGIEPPIVVCNESHRFMVAEQLRELGSTPQAIVLEPVGRNTAPAVAVAALVATGGRRRASDPRPARPAGRSRDPRRGGVPGRGGRGTRRGRGGQASSPSASSPDRAETGYGYIRRAAGRRPGVPRRRVRGEAGRRDGAPLRRVGRVLLEQRHVHVPRERVPGRARPPRAGDAGGLPSRARGRGPRPRFPAAAGAGVRGLPVRFDRLRGHGEDRARRSWCRWMQAGATSGPGRRLPMRCRATRTAT